MDANRNCEPTCSPTSVRSTDNTSNIYVLSNGSTFLQICLMHALHTKNTAPNPCCIRNVSRWRCAIIRSFGVLFRGVCTICWNCEKRTEATATRVHFCHDDIWDYNHCTTTTKCTTHTYSRWMRVVEWHVGQYDLYIRQNTTPPMFVVYTLSDPLQIAINARPRIVSMTGNVDNVQVVAINVHTLTLRFVHWFRIGCYYATCVHVKYRSAYFVCTVVLSMLDVFV